MRTRTNKRSSSGAHTECPECSKRLRGEKGLVAHLVDAHQFAKEAAKEKAKEAAHDQAA